MTLDEFRLTTYEERMVLLIALTQYKEYRGSLPYNDTVEALLKRLSQTQCQEGGCEYCGGGDA